jgi:hypothetical protein
MQRFDKGMDIARGLCRANVLLGLRSFRRHTGEIRRQHDHLALQARPEHGIFADASKGIATQVEQNRTGIEIGDPANDERRLREESSVTRGSCLACYPTAFRQRSGEEPSAEEASRPPDRQRAGAAVVLPCRDLGGALPEPGRPQPVKGPLRGIRGTSEGCKRGLEAKDSHGAGPLLGYAREVAWSDPFEDLGSVGMRLRPAVRSEVAVCLLAAFIGERDNTVLDNDQTLTLREVEGAQEFAGLQATDLDGELSVEAVAQHRQRPDRPGAGVCVHPRTVVPE